MASPAKFGGDIYLGPLDSSGDFLGYLPKVEANSFVPGRDLPDPVELKSKGRDTYGQTLASEQEAGTTSLTIELIEVPASILALAFAGTSSAVAVSAATVTDEPLVVNELGGYYQLENHNIDSANISAETDGDVALVEDTDWRLINARLGLVEAIDGGAITAGDTIKFTYDHEALAATKIIGEVSQTAKFRIYADMQNRVSGKDLHLEYHEVSITVPDVFDLLSDDFVTVTLEGICLTPDGKTSPYDVLSISS